MTKLAGIYERNGVLYVTAAHRTQAGFWIDDGQVVSLVERSSENLGAAVHAALARSTQGVPTPPPTERLDKPLLDAAGVKSWATFMKASKHISVSLDGELMKITPYRNLGRREGFEPQPDEAIASSASIRSLGDTLIEALNRIE